MAAKDDKPTGELKRVEGEIFGEGYKSYFDERV